MFLVFRVGKKTSEFNSVFGVTRDTIRFVDGRLNLTLNFVELEKFVNNHNLTSPVIFEVSDGSTTYSQRASVVRIKGDTEHVTLTLRIWG